MSKSQSITLIIAIIALATIICFGIFASFTITNNYIERDKYIASHCSGAVVKQDNGYLGGQNVVCQVKP